MANRIDIGHDVQIEYRRPAGEGPWWGIAYFHPNGKGGTCEGWIPFNGIEGEKQGWDVITAEPLTLSPSLLCRACGHHGFIRAGMWVPA